MADEKIKIAVEVEDNASSYLEQIGQRLTELGHGSATSGAVSIGKDLGGSLAALGSGFTKLANALSPFENALDSTLSYCGAQIKDFVTNGINDFITFSEVSATALSPIFAEYGFTTTANEYANKQLQWSEQTALDTTISRSEAISLAGELDKTLDAGTVSGMIDSGALTYASKFMKANDLNASDVAKTVAQGINLFGFDATNLGTFFDKIQTSADISLASVESILQGMKYGGPVASLFAEKGKEKEAIDEYLAFAAYSADMGYDSTMGGTSFRRLMSNASISELKLAQLSKTKKSGLEELGLLDYYQKLVDAYAVDGGTKVSDVVGFGTMLDNMGLSDDQKMALAYSMFGMQGLNVTAFDQETYQGYLKKVQGADGSVETKYSYIADSTAGRLESLGATWEATKMAFGEGLSPILNNVFSQAEKFIESGFDFGSLDKNSLRRAFDVAIRGFEGSDMFKGISDIIGDVLNVTFDVFDYALETIPQLLPRIKEIFDFIMSDEFDVSSLGDAKDSILTIFHMLGGMFEDLDVENINNKKLAESLNSIGDLITTLGTFAKGLETTGGIFGGIGSGIVGLFAMVSFLGSLANIFNLFGTGGALGGAVGKGVAEGATQGVVQTLVGKITEGVKRGLFKAFGGGAHGVSEFGSGTETGTASATGWLNINWGSLFSSAMMEFGIPLAIAGALALVVKAGIDKYEQQTDEERSKVKKDLDFVERKNTAKDEINSGQDLNGDGYIGMNYGVNEESGAGRELSKDRKNNKGYQKKLKEGYAETAEDYGLVPVTEIGSKKGKSYQGKDKEDADRQPTTKKTTTPKATDSGEIPKTQTAPTKSIDSTQLTNSVSGAFNNALDRLTPKAGNNGGNNGTSSTNTTVTTTMTNQNTIDNNINMNPLFSGQFSIPVSTVNNITVRESATVTRHTQQIASIQRQLGGLKSSVRNNSNTRLSGQQEN